MSIKPIDYINIISKSQEASRIKQIENEKVSVQLQQGIIQQKKHTEIELKKVQKSNKTEYKVIDKYGNDKGNKGKGENEEKSKKREKGEKRNSDIGIKIDIRI